MLNNKASVQQKEKKIAIPNHKSKVNKNKKSGLTQNKPLEATEGKKHWGQRLDVAYEAGEEWGGGNSSAVGGVSGVV